jgi:hypothetical protein
VRTALASSGSFCFATRFAPGLFGAAVFSRDGAAADFKSSAALRAWVSLLPVCFASAAADDSVLIYSLRALLISG